MVCVREKESEIQREKEKDRQKEIEKDEQRETERGVGRVKRREREARQTIV